MSFLIGWNNLLKILFFAPSVSLLAFLMIEVVTANWFSNTIIGNLDDQWVVLLLIFTFLVIIYVVSIIVGYIIVKDDIKTRVITKASTISAGVSFLILLVYSYAYLLLFIPVFFDSMTWYEFFLNFPLVIAYFGIYAFSSIIGLFIFTLVCYFMLFIYYINKYYEKQWISEYIEEEDYNYF